MNMTTINGRTPEEIKLRLACIFAQDSGWCEDQESCEKCEYNVSGIYTEEEAARDSLILIQQLERERDAAVDEIFKTCSNCKHEKLGYGVGPCPPIEEYVKMIDCSNWQWRGVQEVE